MFPGWNVGSLFLRVSGELHNSFLHSLSINQKKSDPVSASQHAFDRLEKKILHRLMQVAMLEITIYCLASARKHSANLSAKDWEIQSHKGKEMHELSQQTRSSGISR